MTETPGAVAQSASRLRMKIAGMDCASCALTIENGMRQLPGVQTVSVNFATQTLELTGSVSPADAGQRLRELGYRPADDLPRPATTAVEAHGITGFLHFLWVGQRLALIVTALVLAGIPLLAAAPDIQGLAAIDLLFMGAVLLAGLPVFIKGLRALVFARRITIDLLMAVASAGALGVGASGEAVTVILLFTFGEALEAYSAERARRSLSSLLSLQPQVATVLDEHHTAHEADDRHGEAHAHLRQMPIDQIRVDDLVLVRPGERIPVDGVIFRGASAIDQAAVTGESVPVERGSGDEVMAGTVNGEGSLEIRVTRPAGDATIARIARLVEQAQSKRGPAERFIDRFARWYTPAVVALAVLLAVVPVVFFGEPLLAAADGTRGWLYRALTLLIIACPCALVISIPVTVVSSLTRLANLGVLVRSGAALDRLADIRAVAFDKTGTLTWGRPQVTAVRANGCRHVEPLAGDCTHCEDVVALAASVESASEHPLAHAIVAAAAERALDERYAPAAVTAHAGRGVSGELGNGMKISVGSDRLTGSGDHGPLSREADRARAAGDTVMFVARNDEVIGFIGARDEVRPIGQEALAALHAAQPPVATIMLTGDTPQAAERIARRIGGIDEVHAGLLPAQKLSAIEELHAKHGAVAMVGDGINDAPALARADVGIAMGAGSAQAMETADVVLMRDDLSQVAVALRIARRNRMLIRQNIGLSLGLKLFFLALAVPGLATLWMAVLADVGATLLVTLNGMRMLRAN